MRVKYNLDTAVTLQVTGPSDRGAACMLHNAMYGYANLNAVDLHVGVEKGRLRCVTDAVRGLGLCGFSLGEPHKSDIIGLLDEVEPMSRAFRCVNTVVNRGGRLYGEGMDGVGMRMAIEQTAGPVRGRHVLIIGAGAVGGLIPADLCRHGAASVTVANRTPSKAQFIAETLHAHFGVPVRFGGLEPGFLENAAAQADLLVQCSSVGNPSHPELRFESLDFVDCLPAHCVAADVNYPSNPFLERASARGLATVSGEGMLYCQQLAVMQLRFGVELPQDSLREGREAVAVALALRALR